MKSVGSQPASPVSASRPERGAAPVPQASSSPGEPGGDGNGAKPHAFASVFALLGPQMAELDQFLGRQFEAFEPEIRPMVEYCIDTSGKRIRPALVFWAAGREPEK